MGAEAEHAKSGRGRQSSRHATMRPTNRRKSAERPPPLGFEAQQDNLTALCFKGTILPLTSHSRAVGVSFYEWAGASFLSASLLPAEIRSGYLEKRAVPADDHDAVEIVQAPHPRPARVLSPPLALSVPARTSSLLHSSVWSAGGAARARD